MVFFFTEKIALVTYSSRQIESMEGAGASPGRKRPGIVLKFHNSEYSGPFCALMEQ